MQSLRHVVLYGEEIVVACVGKLALVGFRLMVLVQMDAVDDTSREIRLEEYMSDSRQARETARTHVADEVLANAMTILSPFFSASSARAAAVSCVYPPTTTKTFIAQASLRPRAAYSRPTPPEPPARHRP